ncbi:MAG: hypothetical protein LIP05_09185 [Tannerellaceae bacterium]|nr:hypothetical protein [Tannerellaceae bacterium]MCC8133751.1 hypothetical protein [Tannerellaceae bacterium]
MDPMLIPLLGIICMFGMPMLFFILVGMKKVQTKHVERMAMIEKGFVLEEPKIQPNYYAALRNGLVMIGLALGGVSGVYMKILLFTHHWEMDLLICLMTLLGGGIGFIVYFFIARELLKKERE